MRTRPKRYSILSIQHTLCDLSRLYYFMQGMKELITKSDEPKFRLVGCYIINIRQIGQKWDIEDQKFTATCDSVHTIWNLAAEEELAFSSSSIQILLRCSWKFLGQCFKLLRNFIHPFCVSDSAGWYWSFVYPWDEMYTNYR